MLLDGILELLWGHAILSGQPETVGESAVGIAVDIYLSVNRQAEVAAHGKVRVVDSDDLVVMAVADVDSFQSVTDMHAVLLGSIGVDHRLFLALRLAAISHGDGGAGCVLAGVVGKHHRGSPTGTQLLTVLCDHSYGFGCHGNTFDILVVL